MRDKIKSSILCKTEAIFQVFQNEYAVFGTAGLEYWDKKAKSYRFTVQARYKDRTKLFKNILLFLTFKVYHR